MARDAGQPALHDGEQGLPSRRPESFQHQQTACAPDFERLGIDRVPDSYRPDTLWTYEVGSKNQVLDRRATVNAAVYYTDWSKIQQQVNLPTCRIPIRR